MIKFRQVIRVLLVCLLFPPVSYAQDEDQPSQAQDLPTIAYVTPSTVARGDTITIVGSNLSKSGVKTVVKIDGKKAQHMKVHSPDSLEVLVNTLPKTKAKSAGEYDRSLVVVAGEQESEPHTFRQLTWRVILKPRVWVSVILYLALVAWIIFGVNASVVRSETGQLSLSKIQMAMWTFVFGLAYVLLAAVWRDFLDITDGMFWLMGISSATAVGAKAIVLKNKDSIDPNNPSKLLSDHDKKTGKYRLSLHRCQIALWTLVVLVIYVVQLISTMHLPDIPDKLLVLMGVSGGTYLGFNFPKPK